MLINIDPPAPNVEDACCQFCIVQFALKGSFQNAIICANKKAAIRKLDREQNSDLDN